MSNVTNPSETATPQFLSPEEFSVASSLSMPTVRRYLKNGLLPYLQPGGFRARVLIPVSALTLLESGRNQLDPVVRTQTNKSTTTRRANQIAGPKPRWRRDASSDSHKD